MKILAKIIRIITLAPFMSIALVSALYFNKGIDFGGIWHYLAAIFFLAVMPVLAYPIQPLIPPFNKQGRTGQRNLAFITSFIGYIGGVIFCICSSAPLACHIVFWTYFLSVCILSAFNRFTRFRASGHACGVAGPIATLIYFFGPIALLSLVVYAAMVWASLYMKRHTAKELIFGSFSSVSAFLIVLLTALILI